MAFASILPLLLFLNFFKINSIENGQTNYIYSNHQIKDSDIFPEIFEKDFYSYIKVDQSGNPIIDNKMISLIANEIIKNINTDSHVFFDHIKISDRHHKLIFSVQISNQQVFNRIYDINLDV